jgi:SAM-dependent methyltransferase
MNSGKIDPVKREPVMKGHKLKGMEYYEKHHEAFIERTLHVDMQNLYSILEQRLSPGNKILDIGCGPGRDLKYFKKVGYVAIGLEPSTALSDFARQYSRCEVIQTTIQAFKSKEKFDAVWASASLLHLSPGELKLALKKIATFMHEDSVFYCSFKYGGSELTRDGRYYNDLTLESFTYLMPHTLEVISSQVTEQVRPELTQKWLNLFLQLKRS